jgi:hypothetical protein
LNGATALGCWSLLYFSSAKQEDWVLANQHRFAGTEREPAALCASAWTLIRQCGKGIGLSNLNPALGCRPELYHSVPRIHNKQASMRCDRALLNGSTLTKLCPPNARDVKSYQPITFGLALSLRSHYRDYRRNPIATRISLSCAVK